MLSTKLDRRFALPLSVAIAVGCLAFTAASHSDGPVGAGLGVEIPDLHTFEKNTTAVAEEVNENFTRLRDRLRDALTNTATDLGNLQAEMQAIKENVVPPLGSVTAYAGPESAIPSGWQLCDGRTLERAKYAALFAVIETTYGSQDPSTFNLPDYRGYFLRGLDTTDQGSFPVPRDPDRASRVLGQVQAHALSPHEHPICAYTGAGQDAPNTPTGFLRFANGNADPRLYFCSVDVMEDLTIIPRGQSNVAAEVRPTNIAVNYIIRTGD